MCATCKGKSAPHSKAQTKICAIYCRCDGRPTHTVMLAQQVRQADVRHSRPFRRRRRSAQVTMTRTRRCSPLLSDEHNSAELALRALPARVNQRHTARRRPRSVQFIAGAIDAANARGSAMYQVRQADARHSRLFRRRWRSAQVTVGAIDDTHTALQPVAQ